MFHGFVLSAMLTLASGPSVVEDFHKFRFALISEVQKQRPTHTGPTHFAHGIWTGEPFESPDLETLGIEWTGDCYRVQPLMSPSLEALITDPSKVNIKLIESPILKPADKLLEALSR